MLDWKKIVREKLSPLPMDSSKLDEVIVELSQQLEDSYREARSAGRNEAQAAHAALSQFSDWERLRAEICESSEGSRLPVWQSKGFLSPRRPAVWIALALSCVFFMLPTFRKALHLLPFSSAPSAWDQRAFSDDALARLEKSGDKQKYARALAYVALHCPDESRVVPAAEKAIALDPQLTWIAARVSHANYLYPGYDSRPWLNRLQAWDPDNAYVYVLQAGAAVHSEWYTYWGKFNAPRGDLRRALAGDLRWRTAMEKAFRAPRADSYVSRQFHFDRQVLLENGLDRSEKLLMASASAQLPDLSMVKMYADYMAIDDTATKPASARPAAAISAYQDELRFAAKIASPSEAERASMWVLQRNAYERMIPLLRQESRNTEADLATIGLAALPAQNPLPGSESPWRESAGGYRAGRILMIAGFALPLIFLAAALWTLCVLFLRFAPSPASSLNRIASYLVWSPWAMCLCSSVIVLTFWPYSHSIAEIWDSSAFASAFGSLVGGAYWTPFSADLWIGDLFWPVMQCLTVLFVGVIFFAWIRLRRPPRQEAE